MQCILPEQRRLAYLSAPKGPRTFNSRTVPVEYRQIQSSRVGKFIGQRLVAIEVFYPYKKHGKISGTFVLRGWWALLRVGRHFGGNNQTKNFEPPSKTPS